MNSGTQIKTELLGKSREELRSFCVALGEPAFRGAQIYHALYADRNFDMGQITNLPLAVRERLAREARSTVPVGKQRFSSSAGPARYLLAPASGNAKLNLPASVEGLILPGAGRAANCISPQGGRA